MKKKLLATLLAGVLMLFALSLVACGNNGDGDDPAPAADTADTADTADPAPAGDDEICWYTIEDISDMPVTTIRYWFYETPERIALGERQIEEFMDMFPNIIVEGSIAPDNTDNEMLMPFIMSRTNSNIHQSVNTEDLWYIDHDLLVSLNRFHDFEEQFARFNPALNYTWVDGYVYSISWYHTPHVMFYNRAMMEAVGWDPNSPPETYSEFFDFAERVTDPANNVFALAPSLGEEWWRWQFEVYSYYIAAGGNHQTVARDGQTVVFNNEAGLQSLQFFETVFNNGWGLREIQDNAFERGLAAAAIGRTDMIRNIINISPPDFQYVMGPILIPDGVTRGAYDTYSFVRNFTIIDELGIDEGPERSQVRRASWELMKFLLSYEELAADFRATSDFPPIVGFYDHPMFAPIFEEKGAHGEALRELAVRGQNSIIFDLYTTLSCEIQDPLTQSFLRVVWGDMTAVEALDWAEEEANRILREGR